MYKVIEIDYDIYKVWIHYGKTKEFSQYYECWLQRLDYGIAMLMFGLTEIDLTTVKQIVHLLIEDYIEIYEEEYIEECDKSVQLPENQE